MQMIDYSITPTPIYVEYRTAGKIESMQEYNTSSSDPIDKIRNYLVHEIRAIRSFRKNLKENYPALFPNG